MAHHLVYLGIFGSYAYKLPRVWLKDTEESVPTRHLYLNLVWRRADDDEQGMIYDFNFLTQAEAKERASKAPWFKVGEIVDFAAAEQLDEYIDEQGIQDKEARKTLRRLREVVHQAETINFYVEPEQDIDRVLDIFIRTNSGGVPLGYSDLLMSYTTAQWKTRDARAEFDKLVDRVFSVATHGFIITKDFILKTCLTLFSGDVRFKMANLNSSVVDNLEEHWDRVAKAVITAFEFLGDLGFHELNLRGKLPVIPIIQYVYLRRAEANFEKPHTYIQDKAAIRTWLCISVLRGVFRSQTDHLLNQIRRHVEQGATSPTPHFPLDELRAAFQGVPSRSLAFDDAFVNEILTTEIGEATAFPLLTLLYSHLDYARQRIDIDHLHPAAEIGRISELSVTQRPPDWAFVTDPANWNSIANLQPLNESLNRSKQDQSLVDWVAEKKIDRAAYLLPPDVGLDIGSFRAFIEARRTLLAKRLREVVGTESTLGSAST